MAFLPKVDISREIRPFSGDFPGETGLFVLKMLPGRARIIGYLKQKGI
jgi:hypothetical protein